jgi:hypothetical protein
MRDGTIDHRATMIGLLHREAAGAPMRSRSILLARTSQSAIAPLLTR